MASEILSSPTRTARPLDTSSRTLSNNVRTERDSHGLTAPSANAQAVAALPYRSFVQLCVRAFAHQHTVNEQTRETLTNSLNETAELKERQRELESEFRESTGRVAELSNELTETQSNLSRVGLEYDAAQSRVSELVTAMAALETSLHSQQEEFDGRTRVLEQTVLDQQRINSEQSSLLSRMSTARLQLDAGLDATIMSIAYYLAKTLPVVRIPLYLLTRGILFRYPRLARMFIRLIKITVFYYLVKSLRDKALRIGLHSGQGTWQRYTVMSLRYSGQLLSSVLNKLWKQCR